MAGKDGKDESGGLGQHRKEDPPLSGGTPPPGISDGQVPVSGSGSGKRRR
ncbi:hypothetical protein [Streptomyces sp. NPDC048659]